MLQDCRFKVGLWDGGPFFSDALLEDPAIVTADENFAALKRFCFGFDLPGCPVIACNDYFHCLRFDLEKPSAGWCHQFSCLIYLAMGKYINII